MTDLAILTRSRNRYIGIKTIAQCLENLGADKKYAKNISRGSAEEISELAQLLYHRQAHIYHPDKPYGDNEAMIDINISYERIKRLLKYHIRKDYDDVMNYTG